MVEPVDVDHGCCEVEFGGDGLESSAGESAELGLFFEVGDHGFDGGASSFVEGGVGWFSQPVSHLVYVAHGDDVRTAIVNGRVLMKDRQVLTLNRSVVLTEARLLSAKVREAVK